MSRKSRWEEPQYDSVLDTMTNVVGILIIVLAVAEIGVGHALRKTVRLGALGLLDVRSEEPGVGPDAQAETILAIPVPDPERKFGKTRSVFMCRNGRIFPLDIRGLEKVIAEQIGPMQSALQGQELREAVVDHFELNEIGNDHVRVEFEEAAQLRPGGTIVKTLRAEIAPLSVYVGETVTQIRDPRSSFRASLAELDQATNWIYFLVWDDSFEAYIEARRLADRAGFAAGWKPFDRDAPYTEMIGVQDQGREGLPD